MSDFGLSAHDAMESVAHPSGDAPDVGTAGSHRLAVGAAMGRAEAGEADRRETMSALSAAGDQSGTGDPGVTLAGAEPAELGAIGISPDAVTPEFGDCVQGIEGRP